MEETKDIQLQPGKRHGSELRPRRVEITFSEDEYERISALADQAGEKSVAKFIRQYVLKRRQLKARLSETDKKNIDNLHKIGTNIWQIRKDIMSFGIDDKVIDDLAQMKSEFYQLILPYYRDKKEK